MRERTTCKPDNKPQTDPAVGQAAAANAAVAGKAEAWNEDFYTTHVAPLLESMSKATDQNTAQQEDQYTKNSAASAQQTERYNRLGIPAEDAYYKMAKDYSSPDEEQRQASLALGDQRQAEASSSGALMRKFSGIGVDPSSPAALAAMSDQAVQNAAAEAAAQTHARAAAKSLGMQLTSDAANFGRGGTSATLAFSNAASGNSSAGAQGTVNAAATAPGGASPVNNGLGIASRAYGANLDSATSINNANLQQQGAASQGLGQFLGLGLQAAGSIWSDIRLKKNIVKLATLAHDIALYAFNYIWEADGLPKRQGFMAQEVAKVFPNAVSREHGYLRIDYSRVPI